MIETLIPIIVIIFVGAIAGYLSSFLLLKRMVLVGDVLSHVALPGMGIALLLNIDVFYGALASLLLAVVGIWWLNQKTKLTEESLVGIFFTFALAIGTLIIPRPELLESLFGDISKIGRTDAALSIIISLIILSILFLFSGKLLFSMVSEDLAKVSKINVSLVNFIFLILVGLTVALAVKIIGTLLVGALLIMPAASSKNISKNFSQFVFMSTLFGIAGGLAGILLSINVSIAPGPAVVLSSIVIFAFSLIFRLSHL